MREANFLTAFRILHNLLFVIFLFNCLFIYSSIFQGATVLQLSEFVTMESEPSCSYNEVEMSFKVTTNITSAGHANDFEWHAVLRVLDATGAPVLECSDVSSPFTYVARPLKQKRTQLQLNDVVTDGRPGDLLVLTGTHLAESCVEAVLTAGETRMTLRRDGALQPHTYVTRLPHDLGFGVYKVQLRSATEKLSCSRTRILRVGKDQQCSPLLQAHGSDEQGVLPDCHVVAPPADEPMAIEGPAAPFVLDEAQPMAKLPWKTEFEPGRASSLDLFCAQIESFIPERNSSRLYDAPPRARSEDILWACKSTAVAVERDASITPDTVMAVDAVGHVQVPNPGNEQAANAAVALVLARTKSQEALVLKRQLSM